MASEHPVAARVEPLVLLVRGADDLPARQWLKGWQARYPEALIPTSGEVDSR